jgi:type IV pilus assembly protein PilN
MQFKGEKISLFEKDDSESNSVGNLMSRFLRPSKSFGLGFHFGTSNGEGAFSHMLRWYSDNHESLIGIDITPGNIKLCQMEENHGEWKLTSMVAETIPGEFTTKDMSEHVDQYVEKIIQIIKSNNIKETNAAVAIPVSDSIIKTITLPSMSDEEIERAISLGSFWQNLVQLPGDLNEYSVFYEVVKRDEDGKEMDIIFVASKKEDIKLYTDIVTRAGLKPIIVDVRCFALNNLFHINSESTISDTPVVFLKFGPDENYIHIIDKGESFIYDIYISDEERNTIMDHLNDAEILQRYSTQAKQIISIHQAKHSESKIENIFVVSLLPSIKSFVNKLSVMLSDYKVSECNFFDHINIPNSLEDKIKEEDNRSAWAVAMGLAARRLDIFNHHKGEAGADNVNLLPDNEEIKNTKRISLKSAAGLIAVSIICFVIAAVSISSVMGDNNAVSGQLAVVDQVGNQFVEKSNQLTRLHAIEKKLVSLEAIKAELSSNQEYILTAYKHVNRAIPDGVWLTELSFNAPNKLKIKGNSMSDQNVLQFLRALKAEGILTKTSLKTMQVNRRFEGFTSERVKSFAVGAIIEGLQPIKTMEGMK